MDVTNAAQAKIAEEAGVLLVFIGAYVVLEYTCI